MGNKGMVSINAENIMPVIKKWLYSDKDIFVRELVSNGCDAVSKHKRLALAGECPAADAYRVDVVVDKAAGTLSFCDNGIGMTEEEVTKYIAQVAFSGASDFLEKYKPDEENGSGGIIGHFGLGFYSAFMVADRVTIETLSYLPGAEAVKWESEDGMEYEIGPCDKAERGTVITLHMAEDSKEFLDVWTTRATLTRHCQFMPVEIYLKDAADAEKEPELLNDVNPLWMKRPQECTEDEYKAFYHKVFSDPDEPLFWIHLNAEYPFNLKGILYFPRMKNEFSANEGMVKLYNNQVFVADNIKEVIPEFLLLLKGAIDCPDLPLNVSRSFLQNDGYVKKMAAYITRKVADRLVSEFNNGREAYQGYWDDIHPFVKYGVIRDEKFYERVKPALLLKTTEGEYLTLDEYAAKAPAGEENTVLYASDPKRQAQMIRLYTDQGKTVAVLDTLIDNNFISFLEYTRKDDKLSFRRVDAAADGLTTGDEVDQSDATALEKKFRDALADQELTVEVKPFESKGVVAMVTVDEQMRRYQEMSRAWGRGMDMGFPVKKTLVLNVNHPVIKWLVTAEQGEITDKICCQVMDLAEMARQPLEADRMVEFLERSNALLTLLIEN